MDIVALIHKSLSGKANNQEKQALADWIAESPENKEDFEDLKVLLDYSESKDKIVVTEEDYSRNLESLRSKIQMLEKAKKRSSLITRTIFLVAILLLMISAIYIYFNNSGESKIITFSNEPLDNVVGFLQEEYEIKIEAETPSLLRCPFTGVIHRSSSITDIVMTVSKTMNLEYSVKANGSYFLKGKGCLLKEE